MILDVTQDTALENFSNDWLQGDGSVMLTMFVHRNDARNFPKKKNTLRKRIKKSVSQSEHLINH